MSLAVIQALAPGMLWFLPVAALPVVFHLFLRLRRQTRVFPSLQFFLAAREAPVRLHEIVDGEPRDIAFRAEDFDLGRNGTSRDVRAANGFAGFRAHYALNSPAYKDELIVFLGASYFRALGRGQQYGLSARGLALDTVGGGAGEEFPRFTTFWLQRPAPGDTTLTIDALLDSPRATGAYRFVVIPGDTTVTEVRARIYLRHTRVPLAMLGIAPLTSMFLHGENQTSPSDFRPEVHDSDGLLVAADGEWLWRPLFRPGQPQASSFSAQRLQGFGLLQRDRRFAAYEDTEAHYERRPSGWVEPIGDWGPGRVQLLLLPTPNETHDNVVAAWVPARLPAPGQPLDLSWRLHWQGDTPTAPPNGWTVQSRRGHGWLPDDAAERPVGDLQFTIDFDGPALAALPTAGGTTPVEAVASSSTPGVSIAEARAWPHPQGGWRMLLRVQRPDPTRAVELRAFLRRGTDALTETWTALVPQELP